jgi:hypothetical protein
MPINEYLNQVKRLYLAGNATEHSYRPALKDLLESLVKGISATNEPKRQSCGAPDYIIQRKDIPLGYIEAKDIGNDLNKTEKDAQVKRYRESLSNLILTDYLEFRFFQYAEKVKEIKIASIVKGKLILHPENFKIFEAYIQDFCAFKGQTITSSLKLAEMMAHKARMMKDVFYKALLEDYENNTLKDQYLAFKKILIHDLEQQTFADIYAQTITYGLFAARLHDPTLETFTRQEASELIPKSNPFLRNLFAYVSGIELDERVKWIVDDLADIFRATDLIAVVSDFGKLTGQSDPFIHFYETFLAAYDPKMRKAKGVYYTPRACVNFIVRAVDDILKTEFDLPLGLADTSKITIKVNDDASKKKVEKEFHKVQFLDPSTGTGTFLAEVIKQIYKRFEGQEGIWSNYVEEHLIPRLNGFEILMAPYTMCHLKLETLLRESGYKPKEDNKQKRLQVYLTNSLEEAHPDTGTLFASWLSRESIEANYIKRDTPVMVVLGNPPYSGESSNKGQWIMNLLEDYKKEPGGIVKLKEKNSKWINDDYVKFIRFGQYFIEKNREGILAFINPHGFLDNPTFRGMRWNLLKAFDKIYILDLHGNTKKRETCLDGSADENVFDIQQGVSINLFVKTGKKKVDDLGKVFHFDLLGKRDMKYDFLWVNTIKAVHYEELEIVAPNFFFVTKNFEYQSMYENGFSLKDLFTISNSGVVTKRDQLNIHNTKIDVIKMLNDVITMTEIDLKNKYSIPEDVRDWNLTLAKKDILESNANPNLIKRINYRPFDKRYFYYSGKSKGLVGWPVPVVSNHLKHSENLGLMTIKKVEIGEFSHCILYHDIVESHAISMKEINYVFPLYLYPEEGPLVTNRTPNLNMEIVNQIADKLGLRFTPEKENTEDTFAPIDILDYIYAVLHSPTYREKYKEFLKIDFPRVPYPENAETFWQLVKLGGELRQIHLLESPVVDHFISKFPVGGSNLVVKITFDSGKVRINDTQYFDLVPEVAWSFYIGGYQPAQKWLKDRKGRELNFDDICHYQKIIVALTETDRIMKVIDSVVEF